jgi:hypothetical protein
MAGFADQVPQETTMTDPITAAMCWRDGVCASMAAEMRQ